MMTSWPGGAGAFAATIALATLSHPIVDSAASEWQDGPCIQDTAVTGTVAGDFRFMLDPQNPHRGAIPVPLTPADSITVVLQGPECTAALSAYNEKVTPAGQPPIADSVAVVRIGDHHYVVANPDVPTHEALEYLVFDRDWVFRAIVTP